MTEDNNVNNERRIFIRHPSDVPLDVRLEDASTPRQESLSNVSAGGLTFISDAPFTNGSTLIVRIVLVSPVFEARGRVVWCGEDSGRYEIGLEFIETKDAFRMRMVEQICHIEHYKKEIRAKEGRSLTGREAALEWITRYAGTFETTTFGKADK